MNYHDQSTPMPHITDAQRWYLQHALGVAIGRNPRQWGYRNFYGADVGTEAYGQCQRLVELGLMRELRSPGEMNRGFGVFRCTREGCVAAGLSDDRIAEALR